MSRKYRYKLRVPVLRQKIDPDQKHGRTLRICAEMAGIPYDTASCWISGCRHDYTDQALTTEANARAFAESVKIPFTELWEEI